MDKAKCVDSGWLCPNGANYAPATKPSHWVFRNFSDFLSILVWPARLPCSFVQVTSFNRDCTLKLSVGLCARALPAKTRWTGCPNNAFENLGRPRERKATTSLLIRLRRLLRALLPRGNDIPYCRRTIALALTVTSAVMRCRFVIVMMDGGGL